MPTRLRTYRAASCSLALATLAAGCERSDAVQSSPESTPVAAATPAPPSLPPLPPLNGHFRGSIVIEDAGPKYYVEALLTAGGDVRLYIGGPGDVGSVRSGAGIPAAALDPAGAVQFVGNLEWNGTVGSGRGVVIGQTCASQALEGFCATAGPAEINVRSARSSLVGEIRVDAGQSTASWPFETSGWSIYYSLSAAAGHSGGLYSEQLAAFAEPGPMVIDVARGGRLFFQSASSGCTGNGSLTPHADGSAYVFDVDLVIANCSASYAHLNRRFEGLATETQDNAWGYDSWLVMFMSTPDGTAPRSALTMISSAL